MNRKMAVLAATLFACGGPMDNTLQNNAPQVRSTNAVDAYFYFFTGTVTMTLTSFDTSTGTLVGTRDEATYTFFEPAAGVTFFAADLSSRPTAQCKGLFGAWNSVVPAAPTAQGDALRPLEQAMANSSCTATVTSSEGQIVSFTPGS